jgi:hypothetical protein
MDQNLEDSENDLTASPKEKEDFINEANPNNINSLLFDRVLEKVMEVKESRLDSF